MKNHKLVQQIDAVLASHATWHQEMVIEIRRARKDFSHAQLTGDGRRCFFRHWLEGDTLDDIARREDTLIDRVGSDPHVAGLLADEGANVEGSAARRAHEPTSA